ncbi:MAG: hypothetical protein HYR84_07810 [Planctomycetes bacterium]|nr:hypothetical protein [Planctomycetota bacterium]
MDQAEAEGDVITATARKHLLAAERLRKKDPPSDAILARYETGWRHYMHACLKYPRFAQIPTMQDDTYDIFQKYLGLTQKHRSKEFERALTLGAKIGNLWSMAPGLPAAAQYHLVGKLESEKDPKKPMLRDILPARKRYGELDLVHFYDGPGAKELKEDFLFPWIHGASVAANRSVPQAIAFPNGHEYFLGALRTPFRQDKIGEHWRPLISAETRHLYFERAGLNK